MIVDGRRRRALLATAVVVVALGAYASAYALVRWRGVVTLYTPYELAAPFRPPPSPWRTCAYRFFQPAYASEVRFRAWRMERWWRPLSELGIASDTAVAGRGTVARYWYRRGFLAAMTSNPNSFASPALIDPEGVNNRGYYDGLGALERFLVQRVNEPRALIVREGSKSGPTDVAVLDGTAGDHAIVIASLNELRARMRATGFTGLVDNH